MKGSWCYLYRAVDFAGATIDFLLSALRDADAAKRLLRHPGLRVDEHDPKGSGSMGERGMYCVKIRFIKKIFDLAT